MEQKKKDNIKTFAERLEAKMKDSGIMNQAQAALQKKVKEQALKYAESNYSIFGNKTATVDHFEAGANYVLGLMSGKKH